MRLFVCLPDWPAPPFPIIQQPTQQHNTPHNSWEDEAPIEIATSSLDSTAAAAAAASAGAATTPCATTPNPAAALAAGGAASSLSRQPSLSPGGGGTGGAGATRSFIFPSGGLTVRQGLREVAPGVCRVAPAVRASADGGVAVAFSGHLLNVADLAHRYRSPAGTPKRGHGAGASAFSASAFGAPSSYDAAAAAAIGAGALARQGSAGRSLDAGAQTAGVLLAMYQSGADEAVILSELQGEYAFVIVDGARRLAFAARDASGAEPLYYKVGDDGACAFASDLAAVPADAAAAAAAGGGEWRELPPGHYISGRGAKVKQFALTPEELLAREAREDGGLSAAAAAAAAAAAGALPRRARGGAAAVAAGGDGDLFGMEF